MIKQLSRYSVHRLAVAGLVLVAAAYSLLNVSSRLLAEGFPPMTQVYLRISFGALILMALFRKHLRWKRIITMPARDFLILLSMGIIGYSIAVYFSTLAAINAKLINVTVIFASVPFFSYLYAFFVLKKPLNGKLIALLITSLIGITMVATKSFVPHLTVFGKGEWFALLATATMAWFYVGRKLLSTHLNTHEITISVMTIAAISGFLIAILRGETISVSAFTNPHVLLGLVIGTGMNILVNPLEIFAFNHLDAVIGTQVLLLDNVFALLFGYVMYHEMVGVPEMIGGIIIVSSVFVANRYLHEII